MSTTPSDRSLPQREVLDAVDVSEERFTESDPRICYQTFGDPGDPTLLLVMGLSGPMIWWPDDMCRWLAVEGFHVVRFDNRDCGRSDRVRGHRLGRADLVKGFLRAPVTAPYSLHDMAGDALHVLDAVRARAAHVVGASMGGMIAQALALEHRDRVLSLTSIMSTTGSRRAGWQDPRLLPHVLRRGARSREEYVESSARFWRLTGSPAFREELDVQRERAGETWDRGITLSGTMRQMVAIVTAPDRTRRLGELDVPTTVVHGTRDRMVHHSGGRATARAVRGAELVLVPGMGHDLPMGLVPTFVDAILRTAARAGRTEPA